MKNTLTLFISLSLTVFSYAQSHEFVIDHQHHIDQLNSAKDSLYKKTLETYDQHILANPQDAYIQLERCRFIQNAYYDEYEDYNPNYEETEACAAELVSAFPEIPEVLLYPTEFLYGDTLRNYLVHLEGLAEENEAAWHSHSWQLYKQLAEHYSYEDQFRQVIYYGERAVSFNDSLDLTLLLGEAYKKTSNKDKAIEVLLQRLDSTNAPWELNRKGRLLLELGASDKAIEAFRMATKNNHNVIDASGMAKAMIENGLIAEAREYLVTDYQTYSWNAHAKLHALLQYDLNYGTADSARATYRRLTDEHFLADPVGIYRIRLALKDPLIGWTFGDLGRLMLLVMLLIVLVAVPYLWILPIHYIGTYLKQKGKITDAASFRWRLRHFWLACTLWLICDAFAILFFDYSTIVSYFSNSYQYEGFELISRQHAKLTIFFSIGCLVFSLTLLKWNEIRNVLPNIKVNLGAIGVGIVLAFVLRFGLGLYIVILGLFGVSFNDPGSSTIAGVKEAIMAINEFYSPVFGFLIVVIIVPIYEEILFRGVFLSACERNMKFIAANVLQSLVFALLHNDSKLIPFYLAFGFLAGIYTRRTQSLITSTSMHMMNNLIAFIGIYFLQGRIKMEEITSISFLTP